MEYPRWEVAVEWPAEHWTPERPYSRATQTTDAPDAKAAALNLLGDGTAFGFRIARPEAVRDAIDLGIPLHGGSTTVGRCKITVEAAGGS